MMKNFLLIDLLRVYLSAVGFLMVFIPLVSLRVKATVIEKDTQVIKSEYYYSHYRFLASTLFSSEPTEKTKKLELTLQDAVNLTLENNRELKNAYLQRIIERQNLAQEEAIFVPNFTPTVSIALDRDRQLSGISGTDIGEINLNTTVDFLVPSGATFSIGWTGLGQLQSIEQNDVSGGEDFLQQNFTVRFTQPFLRDFGPTITYAPIEIAKLIEDINILSLKSQLIDIITQTILDYRSLVQAQESLKIQQQALARAREELEITQAFIDAGQRARVDIIQNQTQVANQEVALQAAENRLLDAQSQLLQILDINSNSEVIAKEIPQSTAIPSSDNLEPEELLKLAFANNPEYLTALLDIDISQLLLLLAKDQSRWDLSLNINYENNLDSLNNDTDNSRFTASLDLTREFSGSRNLEREVIRSQIELEQNQITLEETKQNLEVEVKNRIRDVNFNLRQVQLARRARELSQQQLEIERERKRLGAGSLFELINFENSLVEAQNQELNAVIDYLNTLTNLQSTLGITLDDWKINLNGM